MKGLKTIVFACIVFIILFLPLSFAANETTMTVAQNTTVATIERYYTILVDYVETKTQYIWFEKIKNRIQDTVRNTLSSSLSKQIGYLDGEKKVVFQSLWLKIIQRKSPSNLTTDEVVSQWELINAINSFRKENKLSQLVYNDLLSKAAYNHANDMYLNFPYDTDNNGTKEIISHIGTDGFKVDHRVTTLGYDYSFVAENIGYNQQTVDELITAWKNSPTHYANLVADKPTDIGVAKVGAYRVLVVGSMRKNN